MPQERYVWLGLGGQAPAESKGPRREGPEVSPRARHRFERGRQSLRPASAPRAGDEDGAPDANGGRLIGGEPPDRWEDRIRGLGSCIQCSSSLRVCDWRPEQIGDPFFEKGAEIGACRNYLPTHFSSKGDDRGTGLDPSSDHVGGEPRRACHPATAQSEANRVVAWRSEWTA